MIGPPTNSARVNCQPSSSAEDEAQLDDQVGARELKAMAEVKLAPLRNSDRARATAA